MEKSQNVGTKNVRTKNAFTPKKKFIWEREVTPNI